jgi:hypothetical protein
LDKLMNIRAIFHGSDGAATKALYAELEKRGPLGRIAVSLLRAEKASERAKVYRGGVRGLGSYRSLAYSKKDFSIQQLCLLLHTHAPALGIEWGWKADPKMEASGDPHDQVLYCDLPQGQVSFHSSQRYVGSEYAGQWDGKHMSQARILSFAEHVMTHPPCSIYPTSPREQHATENCARTGAANTEQAPSETLEAETAEQVSRPLPPEWSIPNLYSRSSSAGRSWTRKVARLNEELRRGNGRLARCRSPCGSR